LLAASGHAQWLKRPAAAVSNAGALDVLALSFSSPEDIRNEIRRRRELTSKPFGANLLLPSPQQERLQVCLEEGVKIVSFFAATPQLRFPLFMMLAAWCCQRSARHDAP
jgi:NAD(P)H-dependent flavin oxidoreductase YrpB (nitropropane dioxygenase family)